MVTHPTRELSQIWRFLPHVGESVKIWKLNFFFYFLFIYCVFVYRESIERLFSSSQIHDKYRNRLPLPVLAARLRRKSLYSGSGDMESDNTYGEGDVVIIWIAGLNVGNYKHRPLQCSIQVTSILENLKLYTEI